MNEETSLIDLDVLVGEEFTGPPLPEHHLTELHAVACYLFSKRNKAALKNRETEILDLHRVLELIALIIGKTYIECGDSFHLADDDALMLIRDQLIQYSPSVIARNKKKRLPKQIFL